MSFMTATPSVIGSAATDLTNIGAALSSANGAAAIPTMRVLAAGADEVSAPLRRSSANTPMRISSSAPKPQCSRTSLRGP